MARVRDRLAEKDVINARLYMHLKQPRSSEYYSDRVLIEYPDSPWAAEAMYLKGEALRVQGKKSEARQAWERLARERPGNDWARRAAARLAELPKADG